jgi:predicted DCC family thiol-disulfide oxidoreductase YuxK
MDTARHPVVFFDGHCGVCNRWVDFMIKRDRARVFRFSPIQGETAKAYFADTTQDELLRTLWLLDETGLHNRSTAVFRAFKRLPWPWRAASLLLVVPRSIRDWGYDWFARNRFRFAGRSETCRIPTADERARFLP